MNNRITLEWRDMSLKDKRYVIVLLQILEEINQKAIRKLLNLLIFNFVGNRHRHHQGLNWQKDKAVKLLLWTKPFNKKEEQIFCASLN